MLLQQQSREALIWMALKLGGHKSIFEFLAAAARASLLAPPGGEARRCISHTWLITATYIILVWCEITFLKELGRNFVIYCLLSLCLPSVRHLRLLELLFCGPTAYYIAEHIHFGIQFCSLVCPGPVPSLSHTSIWRNFLSPPYPMSTIVTYLCWFNAKKVTKVSLKRQFCLQIKISDVLKDPKL